MTMDEICELEREHQRQMFEAQMRAASYEVTAKAINDVTQMFVTLHSAQVMALVHATFNPNFCKPKDAP